MGDYQLLRLILFVKNADCAPVREMRNDEVRELLERLLGM
jgi:hypothetical protein